MDDYTKEVLEDLGMDVDKVPEGVVKVLESSQYRGINKETFKWSLKLQNKTALAYEVETEEKRMAGLVLRNLFLEKPDRAHLFVVLAENEKGPFWHNFTPAIEQIWKTGVVVLVEGPKDARVLYQYDIPVMAYLGAVPTKEHFKVLYKYAHTVLWIPDVDLPLLDIVKRRRLRVEKEAKEVGLFIQRHIILAKDPAELVDKSDEIKKIQKIVENLSLLRGRGYVGYTL